jgi:hypothetical protein
MKIMKYVKMMVLALVMAFTFGAAKAQVVVNAHVGGGYYWHHHHYHHRYWRHHRWYYR